MENKISAQSALLEFSYAKDGYYTGAIIVPGARNLSTLLTIPERSFRSMLVEKHRSEELDGEYFRGNSRVFVTFDAANAAIPDMNFEGLDQKFPTNDAGADIIETEQFIALCELSLAAESSIDFALRGSNLKGSSPMLFGVELSYDNLGVKAEYNFWTGELKTHLG